MEDLTQKAIEASLAGDFKKAIELNKQILKINKNDVEALNRSGCAYFELGEIKNAKRAYKKGLVFDSYNPIILKNLNKISQFKGKVKKKTHFFLNLKDLFLTEPGRTKLTSLVNLPSSSLFLHLTPGTPLLLVAKRRSVAVYLNTELTKPKKLTNQGVAKKLMYLGTLPDDLSFKLLRLIKAGSRYQAYLKHASKNNLIIFIKEILRAEKLKDQPPFLEPVNQTFGNQNR